MGPADGVISSLVGPQPGPDRSRSRGRRAVSLQRTPSARGHPSPSRRRAALLRYRASLGIASGAPRPPRRHACRQAPQASRGLSRQPRDGNPWGLLLTRAHGRPGRACWELVTSFPAGPAPKAAASPIANDEGRCLGTGSLLTRRSRAGPVGRRTRALRAERTRPPPPSSLLTCHGRHRKLVRTHQRRPATARSARRARSDGQH